MQELIKWGKENGKTGISLENLGRTITDFAKNPIGTLQTGLTSTLQKLGPLAVGIGGMATAAIAAGTAIFKFASSAADNAERLENLSAMTGVSVGQLQAFEQIAKEAGHEGMTLGKMISQLNRELGDAKPNEFTKAMAQMGISVKDSSGKTKDAVTVLDEMRVMLLAITDKTERAQAANQLFTGRLREMIPFLVNSDRSLADMTKEMEKAGIVTDDLTHNKLLAFDRKLADIDRSLEAGKQGFVALVASIISVGDGFAEAHPHINSFAQQIAFVVA